MIYIDYNNTFYNKSKFQNLTDFTINVNWAKMGTNFPGEIIMSLNNLQNFNMGGSNNHFVIDTSLEILFNNAIVNGNLKNFNCYNWNLSPCNIRYLPNFGFENVNNGMRKSCLNGIFDNLVWHANQDFAAQSVFYSNIFLKNANIYLNGNYCSLGLWYLYNNANGIFSFDSLINLNVDNLSFNNGAFFGMKEISSIDLSNLNGIIRNFDMQHLSQRYNYGNNRWYSISPGRENLINFKFNPDLIVYNWNIGNFGQSCSNLEEIIFPNNILGNFKIISQPFWSGTNISSIKGLENVSYPTSLYYFLAYCNNLNNFVFSNNFNFNNTKNLSYMLRGCQNFNDFASLEKSSLESAVDMSYTFYDLPQLENIDTINWKFNNLQNMSYTFGNCSNLKNVNGIENWSFKWNNTLKSLDLEGIFVNCYNLTNIGDLQWDVKECKNLSIENIFYNCTNLSPINLTLQNVNLDYLEIWLWWGKQSNWNSLTFNITGSWINNFAFYPAGSWNSSNGENCLIDTIILNSNLEINYFSPRFHYCNTVKNLYLPSNVNILNLEATSFRNCNNLKYIDGFTSINKIIINHDNNTAAFYNCRNLISFSPHLEWVFEKNTSLENAFTYCYNLTGFENTNWYFSGKLNLLNTFSACGNLIQIPNFKNKNEENFYIENLQRTFSSCSNLINLEGLKNSFLDPKIKILYETFSGCQRLIDISALQNWDVSNVINMKNIFSYCNNLMNISALQNWNTSNLQDMGGTFYYCKNLTDISALQNWNTSNLQNMYQTFSSCDNLTDISALQNWNVSNVTNLGATFYSCGNLTDISTLQNWNIKNFINLSQMFYATNIISVNGIINNWKIANEITYDGLSSLFSYCYNLSNINITNWNLYCENNRNNSSIGLFASYCDNLKEVNLFNWDVGGFKSIVTLFYNCYNLINVDMSNWNTRTMTFSQNIFYNCQNVININLANWNTSNLTSFINTFSNCRNLVEINLDGWSFEKVTSLTNCFANCKSLSSETCFNLANLLLNANSYVGVKNLNPANSSGPFYQAVNLQNILNTDIISQLENQGWTF